MMTFVKQSEDFTFIPYRVTICKTGFLGVILRSSCLKNELIDVNYCLLAKHSNYKMTKCFFKKIISNYYFYIIQIEFNKKTEFNACIFNKICRPRSNYKTLNSNKSNIVDKILIF